MGVGVVAFKWAQILYSPPSMKWGLVLQYYYYFFFFILKREREHKWGKGQREREKQTPCSSQDPEIMT